MKCPTILDTPTQMIHSPIAINTSGIIEATSLVNLRLLTTTGRRNGECRGGKGEGEIGEGRGKIGEGEGKEREETVEACIIT